MSEAANQPVTQDSESPPARRWYQFRLAHVLIFFVVVALALGYWIGAAPPLEIAFSSGGTGSYTMKIHNSGNKEIKLHVRPSGSVQLAGYTVTREPITIRRGNMEQMGYFKKGEKVRIVIWGHRNLTLTCPEKHNPFRFRLW